MTARQVVRLLWVIAGALLVACIGKAGISRFLNEVELLALAGLVVTVTLYLQDRLEGKSAFFGPVLIRAHAKDSLSRYVDVLTAAVGIGSEVYLSVVCFGSLSVIQVTGS